MSNNKGRVIWVTGLSGSGKSTLANQVVTRLRATGQTIVMLDGDEMRAVLGGHPVFALELRAVVAAVENDL